jgi:RNA polymerase sigma-70 factor (ECF subfamily)
VLNQSTAGLTPAPSVPEFADLYRAWRRRVCGFFFRRGVPLQDIEDLVQITFTEAWRSWPTFTWTHERQFASWLFAIALHHLLKARRRLDRDAVVVPLGLAAYQLPDEGAGVGFDQALDRALLAPALARLSTPEQQLLADAYTNDQDDRGLGHRLHLHAATAKARRQRAVRHLAVVLATGEPPRRHRRWPCKPAGMSERERCRTAAARQRPSLAVLAS